jgi:hypothetical protein
MSGPRQSFMPDVSMRAHCYQGASACSNAAYPYRYFGVIIAISCRNRWRFSGPP